LHRKRKAFYEKLLTSKLQTLFRDDSPIINQSPIRDFFALTLESTKNEMLEFNKTERLKKKIPKTSASPENTQMKKSAFDSLEKSKKSSSKIYPFKISDQNMKTSPIKKNNHKIEKTPPNIFQNSGVENEKTKKKIVSQKTEESKDMSQFQIPILATPLNSKKVEGIYGLENQILYEIKTNGLISLKNEILDPTEESRNSVMSSFQNQEFQVNSNLIQRFVIHDKNNISKIEEHL